jgi:hypothetical protein
MRKSYKDANKENIRTPRYHGEPQEYRPSTFEKYKLILRLFDKVGYGNNKFYP